MVLIGIQIYYHQTWISNIVWIGYATTAGQLTIHILQIGHINNQDEEKDHKYANINMLQGRNYSMGGLCSENWTKLTELFRV